MNIHRIILSLAMFVFAGGVVVGGTGAFFSDEETSTGNVFAAGSLDLKVDSESHYNGLVCEEVSPDIFEWHADGITFATDQDVPVGHYPQPGDACEGTWAETDLGAEHQFFALNDIKPGDFGENTISLHVYDNDAWGRFTVNNIVDQDNECTEPETEVGALDPECDGQTPGFVPNPDENGELAQSIGFSAWLDQGSIPGFQNIQPDPQNPDEYIDTQEDPDEGDNIQNPQLPTEALFWVDESIDATSEGPFAFAEGLAGIYAALCAGVGDPSGQNDYGECHGLAEDGRMVGSTTYYIGLGWAVPTSVGNEAQSDSLVMDLAFEVEQHRNNPTPFQI